MGLQRKFLLSQHILSPVMHSEPTPTGDSRFSYFVIQPVKTFVNIYQPLYLIIPLNIGMEICKQIGLKSRSIFTAGRPLTTLAVSDQ